MPLLQHVVSASILMKYSIFPNIAKGEEAQEAQASRSPGSGVTLTASLQNYSLSEGALHCFVLFERVTLYRLLQESPQGSCLTPVQVFRVMTYLSFVRVWDMIRLVLRIDQIKPSQLSLSLEVFYLPRHWPFHPRRRPTPLHPSVDLEVCRCNGATTHWRYKVLIWGPPCFGRWVKMFQKPSYKVPA